MERRYRDTDAAEGLSPVVRTSWDGDPWVGGTWIGQIDTSELGMIGQAKLADGDMFHNARILVWEDDQPRGFVEAPVVAGSLDGEVLLERAAALPPVAAREDSWPLPPMTVVVCTRDRPGPLRDVLTTLNELVYPDFEILVVDNNPSSNLTAPVVSEFQSSEDRAIRLVPAVGQGLSIARNAALKNARYEFVAFTDDDVVVDHRWLSNLAYGFSRDERVVCVCGMVPSAEITTPAQSYFDRRVGWARRCDSAVFDFNAPPVDDPLFPMRVSQFGTGANFAVRRTAISGIGGFDEGLGVGSPTGGGEDIDLFVRVLISGHILVREPSAIVWHRHRRSAGDLEAQVYNYGLGLGAWIAKLATRPRTLGMAARRAIPAIKHLRRVTVVEHEANGPPDAETEALYGREMEGVRRGPVALLQARLAGRKAEPMRSRTSKLLQTFDFRRDHAWGEPGNFIVAGRLSLLAFALGLIGSLGAIDTLPSPVLGIALAAFILAGPGSLVLSWYTNLPGYAVFSLAITVSIGICILAVTGSLSAGIYEPLTILLVLTALTSCGGLARCIYLARRAAAGERA